MRLRLRILQCYTERANNIAALNDASAKVDRAMRADAVATGCGVTIETMAGYLPVIPMRNTAAIDEALECFRGRYPISKREGRAAGATDTGDLSSIMPVMRFKAGGYNITTITNEYL